jgi:hypothetical protein
MFAVVDVKQIEDEAMALPAPLLAGLVGRLLQTLPPPDLEVSDEEAAQRDQELESGTVTAISHEEFVRRIEQSRGK